MVIEENVVRDAIAGDKASFETIYTSMYKDMYRIAYYMLGSVEDAKDVVSETTYDMYKYIGTVKKAESFVGWAMKILYTKCKKKRKEYVMKNSQLDEEMAMAGESDSVIESVDLNNALESLEETERVIVLLSAVQGFNSSEIGKILGMLPNTVRSKLKRSLDKMRERMISYEG